MTLCAQKLFDVLLTRFGPQHWWPVDHAYHKTHKSDPRFEIIIGAILTQNTAWSNVEKALDNLKNHTMVEIEAIAGVHLAALKTMIQPSGFFNQKAQRLKTISSYLQRTYNGNLSVFFSQDTGVLRKELLELNGIGPETADSILLYAGDKPVFVIDAYTRRIARRFPLPVQPESYDELQRFFEESLQKSYAGTHLVQVYKELHALLVVLAKEYCRPIPRCNECPLTDLCQKSLEFLPKHSRRDIRQGDELGDTR